MDSPSRINRKQAVRGSLTVEAAMVIPVVLLMLFWLAHTTLFLYRLTAYHSYVSQTADAADRAWDNPRKALETGALNDAGLLRAEPLYRQLSSADDRSADRLEGYLAQKTGGDVLLRFYSGARGADRASAEVVQSPALGVRQELRIKVVHGQSGPLPELLQAYGILTNGAAAVVTTDGLTDPAERIRTLDWGAELLASRQAADPALGDDSVATAESIVGQCRSRGE